MSLMSSMSSLVSGTGSRRGSTVSTVSQHLRSGSLRIGKTANSKWLIHTVAEFCQQVAIMYDHFAINLQSLVETFQDHAVSKDKMYSHRWFTDAWKKVLDQYAVVSTDYYQLAHSLECSVSNSLQEASVHKHAVLDEVLQYRDDLLKELEQGSANLAKVQKEFSDAWHKMERDGKDNIKNHNTALCYNKHNDYVLELVGVNTYNKGICTAVLPSLSKEIERIHGDIAELVIHAIIKHAELTKSKLNEHGYHMDAIISAMHNVELTEDALYCRTEREHKHHDYVKPESNASWDCAENKLVLNAATEKILRNKYDTLIKEVNELERNITAGKEILAKLKKQHDSIKVNHHPAKVAEVLKKIYHHKVTLQKSEVSLESKRAKLKLFTADILSWKLSNGHAVTSRDHSPLSSKEQQALCREAKDSFSELLHGGVRLHCFQEYNFKIPTFCDHCRGLLKGIIRQGLRCKLCKLNIHQKCQDAMTECKGALEKPNRVFRRQTSVRDIKPLGDRRKLLRRQKSSSELEIPRHFESAAKDVDPVYEAIKCAANLSSNDSLSQQTSTSSLAAAGNGGGSSPSPQPASPTLATASLASAMSKSGHKTGSTQSLATPLESSICKSAPHSPSTASDRRKILETYGKSMSFDGHRSHRPPLVPGRFSEPAVQEPNLKSSDRDYVVLYNFEGMMRDDLSLMTGDRVHVIDNSGTEWWKGEVNGACGFFPSFCVTLLKPWEQIVRVTHTYKASHDVKDGIALKKDQVVIRTSSDDSSSWARVSTRKQTGVFPSRYLQPVVQSHTL